MGVYSGPEIVKDGLVLHLDAATAKSFRGEPTVNLINNPLNPNSGWNHTNMTISADSNGFFLARETTTNGAHLVRQSFTTKANTIYTFSCLVKKFNRRYVAMSFTSYGNWSGGSGAHTFFDLDNKSVHSFLGGGPISSGIQEVSPGIFYIWITAQSTSVVVSDANLFTYENSNFLQFAGNVDSGVFFKNFQLEEKPYPTPFVNGTRGTTVATGGGWADLSGNTNHGELVNGPTFNNGNLGSLVFDGVDDYIEIPTTTLLRAASSISSWVYIDDFITGKSVPARTFIRISSNNFISVIAFYNGGFAFESNTNSNPHELAGRVSPSIISAKISSGTWFLFSLVFSSDNFFAYVNDQSVGNGSLGNNLTFNRIGDGGGFSDIYPAFFKGKISNFKIYNRALSQSEIRQNFYATRGRYGV